MVDHFLCTNTPSGPFHTPQAQASPTSSLARLTKTMQSRLTSRPTTRKFHPEHLNEDPANVLLSGYPHYSTTKGKNIAANGGLYNSTSTQKPTHATILISSSRKWPCIPRCGCQRCLDTYVCQWHFDPRRRHFNGSTYCCVHHQPGTLSSLLQMEL